MNPFKYFSKTYVGAVAAAIGFVMINFGFATEGEISELVAVSLEALGILGVIFDRLNKRDINLVGFRK